VTRSPSPSRAAKSLSLNLFVVHHDGVLALTAEVYKDLFEIGLNRSDVRQAIDDLVAEGTISIAASASGVWVSVEGESS